MEMWRAGAARRAAEKGLASLAAASMMWTMSDAGVCLTDSRSDNSGQFRPDFAEPIMF